MPSVARVYCATPRRTGGVNRDLAHSVGHVVCRRRRVGACAARGGAIPVIKRLKGRKVREFWRRSLLLTAGQRRAREHRAAMLWGIRHGRVSA